MAPRSTTIPTTGIPGLDNAIVAAGLHNGLDLDPQWPVVSVKEHLQHRHDPINNKTAVRRYTAMFKAGSMPPPIGVTRDGLAVWGNHRLAAAEAAGVAVIPAIIFDVDGIGADDHLTDLLLSLAVDENAPHGVPYTEQDRVDRAKSLIKLGYQNAAISMKLGLNAAQVSRIRRELDADKRLTTLKINFTGGTPTRSVIQALGSPDAKALNDAPFRELARLTDEAGLAPGDITTHAKAAKASGSDVDAMNYIAQVRNDLKDVIAIKATTGLTTRPGPVSKVKDACKRVVSLCDISLVPTIYRDYSEDAADTVTLVENAIKCLQSVLAVQVVPEPETSEDGSLPFGDEG